TQSKIVQYVRGRSLLQKTRGLSKSDAINICGLRPSRQQPQVVVGISDRWRRGRNRVSFAAVSNGSAWPLVGQPVQSLEQKSSVNEVVSHICDSSIVAREGWRSRGRIRGWLWACQTCLKIWVCLIET